MLLKLLQHLLNSLHVLLVFAFGIDEDVIKVHYYKNVELLCQNLVDIALECDRCVDQSERYDLVLEVVIAGPEGRLSFIAFSDPHLMVGIDQIKLGEMLSPT